jgi:hypothetical protein
VHHRLPNADSKVAPEAGRAAIGGGRSRGPVHSFEEREQAGLGIRYLTQIFVFPYFRLGKMQKTNEK